MSIAIPAHDGQKIMDEIVAFKEKGLEPSSFEIASLRKRLRVFKDSDAGNYYAAMGALSALLKDKAGAIKNHEKSIMIMPSPAVYGNYATSLKWVNEFESSVHYAKVALQLDPTNIKFIAIIIESAIRAKDTSTAAEFTELLKKMTGQHIDLSLLQFLSVADDLAEEHDANAEAIDTSVFKELDELFREELA